MYNLFIKKKLFAKYPYLPKSVLYNIQTLPEGMTSGSGSYERNSFVTVSAIAPNGYKFVKWTENRKVVSTKPNYTFIINSDRELVANFEENTHIVTTSVNPTGAGTTTGSGTYTRGDSVTVNATANLGYNFVNWTENGNEVSTNPQYTFTITNNRNLIANFEEVIYKYKISVCQYDTINDVGTILSFANSEEMTTPNPGEYTCKYNDTENGKINITANEIQGYEFKAWKINEYNENDITSPAQKFQPDTQIDITSKLLHYIARYEIKTFNVNVESSYEDEGTVSGGGLYNYNTPVTIKAVAKDGYEFVNWTENGEIISTNTQYTFTVTENRNFVANFEYQIEELSKKYLIFQALDDGCEISFDTTGALYHIKLNYSIDKGTTWNQIGTNTVKIDKNQYILFKKEDSVNVTRAALNPTMGKFIVSKLFKVLGHPYSLITDDFDAETVINKDTPSGIFTGLFADCTTLKSVPKNFLFAKHIVSQIYSSMFSGCTQLEVAPDLPATTAADSNYNYGFYQNMFYRCTSLKTGPTISLNLDEISNGSTPSYIFYGMFQGCENLSSIKFNGTDTLIENTVKFGEQQGSFDYWVNGVSPSGTLTVTNDSYLRIFENENYKNIHGVPQGWTLSYVPEITVTPGTPQT